MFVFQSRRLCLPTNCRYRRPYFNNIIFCAWYYYYSFYGYCIYFVFYLASIDNLPGFIFYVFFFFIYLWSWHKMYLTFFSSFLYLSLPRDNVCPETRPPLTLIYSIIYIGTHITFQVLVLHSSHELIVPQPLSPLRRTHQQPLIPPPPHTRTTTHTTHHLWQAIHFLSTLYIIIIVLIIRVCVCKR